RLILNIVPMAFPAFIVIQSLLRDLGIIGLFQQLFLPNSEWLRNTQGQCARIPPDNSVTVVFAIRTFELMEARPYHVILIDIEIGRAYLDSILREVGTCRRFAWLLALTWFGIDRIV